MNFDTNSTSLNSLSLNSFRKFEAACRALKTVRLITEKKNLLSEIGEFLNDSKIIQILDSLTSGQLKIEYDKENVPQYSQFSSQQIFLDWNVLFDLLQNFVLNELKTIMDKSFTFSQSQRTASSQNIDNKIYQLRAVLSLVLNQINSRSQINLELSIFLDFFDSIVDLSNDFTTFQAKILNDLSNFLLNQILNNPTYCHQIKKPKWIEFLNFFTNNYLNHMCGNTSIDPVCSVKCLRKILSNVLQYAGLINMTKVFSILSIALIEIKKDSNPEMIENLIGCAYELSTNFQNDCLFEVKKFGEEISIKLLDLCDSRIGCVNSKELLIKFLVLQINLHKKSEKNNLMNNASWIKIIKSSYEWCQDEIHSVIHQKLISVNLKTNRTNYRQFSEIEESLFFLISECWFTLSNHSDSLTNNRDIIDSNKAEDSPVKKRKIDYNIYSWSFIISQIEQDLDHAAKIYWSKFFEKIFKLHFFEIQKEIIDLIILKFLNKNLSLLEKKIVNISEDRIRLNLVINSTLYLLSALLKNNIEQHSVVQVDFWHILNYCFNNRSFNDLILI